MAPRTGWSPFTDQVSIGDRRFTFLTFEVRIAQVDCVQAKVGAGPRRQPPFTVGRDAPADIGLYGYSLIYGFAHLLQVFLKVRRAIQAIGALDATVLSQPDRLLRKELGVESQQVVETIWVDGPILISTVHQGWKLAEVAPAADSPVVVEADKVQLPFAARWAEVMVQAAQHAHLPPVPVQDPPRPQQLLPACAQPMPRGVQAWIPD